MLILSRKPNETIRINDNISITVLKVNGSQVSIGIDAPKEIEVYREEIYHRVQAERNNQ